MNKQRIIISVAIFFAFVLFIFPKISSADVLLPGSINTCGELAVPGVYTLTSNVGNGTSTCFTISSDNVIINGGGYTISGSGSVAIDARPRTGGPAGALTEGANGYTNLIINELSITGYSTGINLSGNADSSGAGVTNGAGGNGGDVALYYSTVGSITSSGGNSTSRAYGGIGGNILLSSFDLNIASSTLSVLGGTGTTGRNTDGGLDLNYTNSLIKTNLTLSSLSFFNDNTTNYGIYIGGTWPITPGNISTCGTLFGSGTYTLTQSISGVNGTCFTIGSNDIVLNGAGYTVTSATTTNTSYFANASIYSNFTLASTTATNFSNLVTSSSTVTVSGTTLNLSSKKITSPNITIDAGALTVATTTFSTLVLNINYSVSIAGTSTATTTSDLTSFKVNNLEYGSRLVSNALFGDVWYVRTSAGLLEWREITVSADGMKIIASSNSGYLFGSIDGGITWTQRTSDVARAWYGLSSSADGMKVVGVVNGNYIYISNDGGFTWTPRFTEATKSWYSVAMSADGLKIVAGAGSGYLYTSSDGGDTWTARMTDANRYWYNLTSSADGTKIFGAVYSDYIYFSTDSGVTWATSTNSGSRSWYSIASDSSGTKIVAGVSGGYLYVSNDGGATWTPRVNDTTRTWYGVTSSADGVRLAASVVGGKIYTSIDSGANWVAQESNRQWYNVASSKDGNKLFALFSPGYIYTRSDPAPALSVDIMSPYSSSSVILWRPIISWGISKYCYYSYDNFVSTSTANCSLSGSDILPPSSGNATLYVKGISNMGAVIAKSVNFTNNSNQNIQVNLPALNTRYDALTWFPNIDYSTTDASLVTCQYSYNNWVSTSTVNCANNGSDILPPAYDGQSTLSIRTIDGIGNINSISIPFAYMYSFVKNSLGGSRYWQYDSFAMSFDGMKIISNMTNGYIWTSTDGGASWIQRTSDSFRSWHAAASSDDGVKLVAAVDNGYIYTSTTSGVTWTTNGNSSGSRPWFGLTSSSDGLNLAASTFPGYIYTSNDSGITWTQRTNSGSRYWYGLASSADGVKLAAAADSGYIYIYIYIG